MRIIQTDRGLMTHLILALPKGLHARPSAKVAQTAREFKSDILLIGENGEVDAKSMLDVLSLSSPPRAHLTLIAKGSDAKQALERLYVLLTTGE